MASACDHDQQHKFYPFHQVYNLNKRGCLKDLDIPPRKLLSRRAAAAAAAEIGSDMFIDSPRGEREREREQTLFQKFLPYNNVDEDDDDDADPYSADHFRMYEFKVRKCNRSRSHDWTDCPFSHPGEKARRRDPRRFNYTGTVCPEFRRGSCSRGENCEFAHGVFECWLHPSRYRTEACKDGKNCKRKVCFFAHTPRQIRILPVNCHDNISPMNSPFGVEKSPRSHCCTCCHSVSAPPLTGMSHSHMSRSMSPPMMMSQSLSPPHSPMRYSPVSRFNDRFDNGGMGYKDAVTELMSSLEAMNVNEVTTPHYGTKFYNGNNNLSWVDVNFNGDDQQQFVLSPSTPSSAGSSRFSKHFMEENNNKYNDNSFVGGSGPDLGWVNDLLT